MKFTKKDEVWQDTVSGVCYTREHAIMPIAIVDGPAPVTKFGVLLKPYCGEQAPVWADWFEEVEAKPTSKDLGYPARNLGQRILVSEAEFETRFKSLGILSEEVDLEALVAQYEAEECDFSNRSGVIRSVTQQLQRMGPGMWTCELYTMLKDYIANTPATKL